MVASRFFRPSRTEFFEMMAHLRTYSGTGAGAEQDFLTDFWKNKGGIAGLPRKYNCQLHQVALMGPEAEETSVYWRMVANYEEEVANWHFSGHGLGKRCISTSGSTKQQQCPSVGAGDHEC